MDEPVADARDRDDPLMALWRVAEGFAQGGDLHRQVALLDHGVRPCGIHQYGFGDHGSIGFQQRAEKQKSPLIDVNDRSAFEQRLSLNVKNERSKNGGTLVIQATSDRFA